MTMPRINNDVNDSNIPNLGPRINVDEIVPYSEQPNILGQWIRSASRDDLNSMLQSVIQSADLHTIDRMLEQVIAYNDTDIIKQVLELIVQSNNCDIINQTLQFLIEGHHNDALEELLQLIAQSNNDDLINLVSQHANSLDNSLEQLLQQRDRSSSPLGMAIRNGHLETVRSLLESLDNSPDDLSQFINRPSYSVLEMAAQAAHREIILALVEQEARAAQIRPDVVRPIVVPHHHGMNRFFSSHDGLSIEQIRANFIGIMPEVFRSYEEILIFLSSAQILFPGSENIPAMLRGLMAKIEDIVNTPPLTRETQAMHQGLIETIQLQLEHQALPECIQVLLEKTKDYLGIHQKKITADYIELINRDLDYLGDIVDISSEEKIAALENICDEALPEGELGDVIEGIRELVQEPGMFVEHEADYPIFTRLVKQRIAAKIAELNQPVAAPGMDGP